MIETETTKVQNTGNGVTTVFPYTFPILAATELEVTLTSTAGIDALRTLNTHYTVSGVLNEAGGSVTMFIAPAAGELLTVRRSMVFKQTTDLPTQSGFNAAVLEQALDRVTMLALQLREELGRAAKLPTTSLATSFNFPTPDNGKYLGWTGGLLANLTLQTTALSVSAFIQTLLDDATAGVARVTLGEQASGSFFTRQHNFTAAVAPTVNEDTGDGYTVGSFWFDLTGDAVYCCVDATLAAAVWRAMVVDRGPGFKNRITNGDVHIDQRNAGAAVSVNTASTFFGPDMWRATGQAADGVFNIARSTAAPPAGFTHFLRATITTADAAIGAAQAYAINVPIEGNNASDLGFGAAGAQTITVALRVRVSTISNPVFSGSVVNAAGNRAYPFSFTMSAANTWETKTITIAGDVTGTWPTDSTRWGSVFIDIGSGANSRAAANAWTAAAVVGVTGAATLISTIGATLDITGAQLEPGSAATEFERRPISEQEARCARYYQRFVAGEAADRQLAPYFQIYEGYVVGAAVSSLGLATLQVPMRAAPTCVRVGSWTLANAAAQPTLSSNSRSAIQALTTSTAAGSVSAVPGAATGYTLDAELA